MKISFTKYPIDIIICIIWSTISTYICLVSNDIILRTIIGLPLIIFIPGYILLSDLFPLKKMDKGIDGIERIAFSFGLSIVILPLLGFILNFTPWGIQINSILFFLLIFIFILGIIALYRWIKSPIDKRFIVSFEISLPKSSSRILVILLIFSILITIGSLIYVVTNSRNGETFTEFYILAPTGKTNDYPKNLTKGENASLIIGLVNHEYKPMNYTVEIWLIDQKNLYNLSTNNYVTIYPHMWFMDKINITLNQYYANSEKIWNPQWEYQYNFNINRVGKYKLTFLLFTAPTEEYNSIVNYREIAAQKINNAYKNTYIWIDLT